MPNDFWALPGFGTRFDLRLINLGVFVCANNSISTNNKNSARIPLIDIVRTYSIENKGKGTEKDRKRKREKRRLKRKEKHKRKGKIRKQIKHRRKKRKEKSQRNKTRKKG